MAPILLPESPHANAVDRTVLTSKPSRPYDNVHVLNRVVDQKQSKKISTSMAAHVPTVLAMLITTSLVPTAAAIPGDESNINGEENLVDSGTDSSSDDFSSYWITVAVAILGMIGLYVVYRYLLSGKSKSGTGGDNSARSKGAYSPVSQNERDLEMTPQGNTDDWDDWEENNNESNREKKELNSSSFSSIFTNSASSRSGGPTRRVNKKPPVNVDDWDDELALESAEDGEEEMQDEVEFRTKSKPSSEFNKPQTSFGLLGSLGSNSIHNNESKTQKSNQDSRSKSPGSILSGDNNSSSRHGMPTGMESLHTSKSQSSFGSSVHAAVSPTNIGIFSSGTILTAVKKSNKYQLPVEDVDLFASIGIAAAPKMKEAEISDIENIFGSLTGQEKTKSFSSSTIHSTPSKTTSKPSRTSKPVSNDGGASSINYTKSRDGGRLSTALIASDDIHYEQWDEDKELDALIEDD
jgi:hypothetical protein